MRSHRYLFIHGFLGSAQSWNAVLACLGERMGVHSGSGCGAQEISSGPEFRTVAIPGHAHTPAIEGVKFIDVLETMVPQWLEPEHTYHLVGYSLGARMAQHLLTLHPSAFHAATFIGVHPGLQSSGERRTRRAQDAIYADLVEQQGMEDLVSFWERLPIFSSQARVETAVLLRQREIRCDHNPQGIAWVLRTLGLAEMPDALSSYRECKVPITLVSGARDPKFSMLAADIAEFAPNVRVQTIQGCGHNPLIEAPRQLAEMLL